MWKLRQFLSDLNAQFETDDIIHLGLFDTELMLLFAYLDIRLVYVGWSWWLAVELLDLHADGEICDCKL